MEPTAVVQFKKRSRGGKPLRRKDDNSSEEDETEVNKAVSVSASKLEFSSSSGSAGRDVTVSTVYESKREVVPHSFAGSATATVEINTSFDRDAIALKEKEKAAKASSDKLNISTIKASEGQFGPKRAPTFLRATSRFDYAPDICKDYKETGFCGYGDNCKFLHDRGDYKSGWQMELEWNKEQREKKRKLVEAAAVKKMQSDGHEKNGDTDEDDNEGNEEESGSYEIEEEDSKFPFACHICREPFQDPVVTLCGHYFCSQCAIEQNKTNNRCAVCDKQTFGVFNKARQLARHISSQRGAAGGISTEIKQSLVAVRKGNWSDIIAANSE